MFCRCAGVRLQRRGLDSSGRDLYAPIGGAYHRRDKQAFGNDCTDPPHGLTYPTHRYTCPPHGYAASSAHGNGDAYGELRPAVLP